jgi:hypothetical protein
MQDLGGVVCVAVAVWLYFHFKENTDPDSDEKTVPLYCFRDSAGNVIRMLSMVEGTNGVVYTVEGRNMAYPSQVLKTYTLRDLTGYEAISYEVYSALIQTVIAQPKQKAEPSRIEQNRNRDDANQAYQGMGRYQTRPIEQNRNPQPHQPINNHPKPDLEEERYGLSGV